MPTSSHPIRTVAVLGFATLAYSLGQTLLVPALPQLIRALHTNTADISWTLTAFFISVAVASPILGKLGDMFGKRRMAVLAMGAYGVGALVAVATSNLWIVVVGRAIQGLGGTIVPLSFSLAGDLLPQRLRARSVGLLSATAAAGGSVAIVVGGVIADHISWRWLFWASAILAVSSMLALLSMPESPVRTGGRVDLRGASTLGVGLAVPLFGISRAASWGWGDPRTLGLLAGGVAILAGWVRLESRTDEPLANIALLRSRPVLLTNAFSMVLGYVLIAGFVLVPQLAQVPRSTGYGFGVGAVDAGLLLLPATLGLMVVGPLSGSAGARFGNRTPMVAGALMAAVAFALLAADHETRLVAMLFTMLALAGGGFAFAASMNMLLEAVPATQTGEATGFNSVVFRAGQALGTQVSGTLLAAGAVASTGFPRDDGYTNAFIASAAVALAGTGLAFLIPATRSRGAGAGAPRSAESAGG